MSRTHDVTISAFDLDRLEAQLAAVTEQRDAALIGYNECRATIEDARRALGATAHEGPLLAAMRVTEQRDRLAEALRELCETLLNNKPRDITESLYKAGDALAAWKGGSDD
jgi:septal ring factor EnvC (AmiA/AmiB activator)